jgi:hypothetical protein
MAASQAAYGLEKAVGHTDESIIQQDVSTYNGDLGKEGTTMKALTWQGKNKVVISKIYHFDQSLTKYIEVYGFVGDVQRPKILEDGDVILKVTGTTVCGSDLHLLHGRQLITLCQENQLIFLQPSSFN